MFFRWSKIASHLPGRTDNEIKNVWNTRFKKRLAFKISDSKGNESKESSSISSSSCSSTTIMSGGKRNMATGLDQQWSHGSVTKRTRLQDLHMEATLDEFRPTNKEANEMPSPSSSSSYNSNVTNRSQVDVSVADDQMGSLFNFSAPHPRSMIEDVSFESDLEFWNMLDGLNAANEGVHLHNVETSQSSSLGVECNGEVENRKWLRYLENELGLESTRDGNQQNLSAVPETYQYEMP